MLIFIGALEVGRCIVTNNGQVIGEEEAVQHNSAPEATLNSRPGQAGGCRMSRQQLHTRTRGYMATSKKPPHTGQWPPPASDNLRPIDRHD